MKITDIEASNVVDSSHMEMVYQSPAEIGAAIVRERLQHAHATNRSVPLAAPDHRGVFPESWLDQLLHRNVLVAVIDANWLRADVKRACLDHKRTVLITAANSRALRLYVAEHVVREFEEHCEEWAVQCGVSYAEFWNRWEFEYLPMLNVIPDGSIPLAILSPEELRRVSALAAVDADDIPSVTLSLALGAIYLSKDKPAFYAVYDANADYEIVHEYLKILMAGSDSHEIGEMLFTFYMLPTIAGYGAVNLARTLAKQAPWLLGILGGAAVVALLRMSKDTYAEIKTGCMHALSVLAEVQRPYQETLARFRQSEPHIPAWDGLSTTLDRRALRLRACLQTLAREPQQLHSARELAELLPTLGIGKSEKLVRATLRENNCFCEPVAGKWKVGATFRYQDCDASAGHALP